ncbi:hypothetical protein K5X82_01350 [Halosquirtibacter xylanolyticus]|uniref:hypothetical protein n=1 Tax=Halosquirtibacter xylanolyticus TaxID=3374599 RepID=UPI003748C1E3|nr:hypothetical protein K5X82_01350 [Prolixibacteraceae bacterium]
MAVLALESLAVFVLSLWKIYLGFAYLAIQGYSLIYACLLNLSAVAVSVFFTYLLWKQGDKWPFFNRFRTHRSYQKAIEFWRRNGAMLTLILSPILIGIPTYVIIALEAKISIKRITISMIFISFLWGILCYYGSSFFVDDVVLIANLK